MNKAPDGDGYVVSPTWDGQKWAGLWGMNDDDPGHKHAGPGRVHEAQKVMVTRTFRVGEHNLARINTDHVFRERIDAMLSLWVVRYIKQHGIVPQVMTTRIWQDKDDVLYFSYEGWKVSDMGFVCCLVSRVNDETMSRINRPRAMAVGTMSELLQGLGLGDAKAAFDLPDVEEEDEKPRLH